jgi:hypothetical protein
MKLPPLTPTLLRQILAISLFVISFIGGGLFYVINNMLQDVATDVSHTTVDANTSRNNIQVLEQLETSLKKQQDIIGRADKVRADSASYNYQNQIINDLNTYASRANIKIANIDFSADISSSTSKTPVTSSSAAKTISVTVSLKSPMPYSSLLNFLNSIEQSLPKMQISSVGITKSEKSNEITSDVLTLSVYTQ